MQFKVVQDIDTNKVWISPEVDYGDYPLRYQMVLEYTEEYDSEWAKNGKYHLSIKVTSLVAAQDKLKSVQECIGMNDEDWAEMPDEYKHLELAQYGTAAVLWQEQGNNIRKLIKNAREEMKKIEFMFGFYMDRPMNMIGSTGWDFISGDTLAPLNRIKD